MSVSDVKRGVVSREALRGWEVLRTAARALQVVVLWREGARSGSWMRSRKAMALLFAAILSESLFPVGAQERTVSVFGWGDYIDPKVIEDFSKETGIKVTYDAYDSTEELERQLEAGKTGFDLVIVPADILRKQGAAGLYQKLDKSKLPNSKNLSPEVMARLEAYDRGNQYAVNYMWFTAGIAYNADKINKVLGDAAPYRLHDGSSAPSASWGALFRLDNLKKFASCGVMVLDSGGDMFALALIYLKGDPAIVRWSDFKNAAELLKIMRRNVKKFDSTGYADALVNGDICLAAGYSVDSLRARERTQEADNGVEIGYVIPKEGSLILLDNLAIPKEAPRVAEAYQLMNFLLRPDIAARNASFTRLASGVLAAKSANSKGNVAQSSDAVMQRLFTAPNYSPPLQKAIQQEWSRIKAGK